MFGTPTGVVQREREKFFSPGEVGAFVVLSLAPPHVEASQLGEGRRV